MGAIDADAHVIESPATWEFLDPADKIHTPMIVSQTYGETVLSNDLTNVQNNYWVVGNRLMAKDRNVGLELTREISTVLGEKCIRIHDRIENLDSKPTPPASSANTAT